MKKYSLHILLSLLLFTSCKTDDKKNQSDIKEAIKEEQSIEDNKTEKTSSTFKSKELESLIASIPPPIEMSTLILSQNVSYDNTSLHNVNNVKNYHNSYSQAFNLGIYGTDLGYTNLHKQNSDAILYFDCVNKLSHELSIEKYFDIKLMSKLTREEKLDSVLTLTTDGFSKINEHFIDLKTPQLSISVIAGSWIESLYLLSQTYQTNPNKELQDKIGEQKISLELLTKIIHEYETNLEMESLRIEFDKLTEAYKSVNITDREMKNIDQESLFNEDGTMNFSSNVETIVNVDKESLNNIISTILSARNKLIL